MTIFQSCLQIFTFHSTSDERERKGKGEKEERGEQGVEKRGGKGEMGREWKKREGSGKDPVLTATATIHFQSFFIK